MKSSDPGSLQNLNDIVLPANVGWWPLASGWYFLLGILLITFTWFAYRSWQSWMANRYRRAAIKELLQLQQDVHINENRDAGLRQLPVLLKRAALAAYPRSQVASLSGQDWIQFLDSKLKNPIFTEVNAITLEKISYSNGDLNSVDSRATNELLSACSQWLKHHQTPPRLMGSRES